MPQLTSPPAGGERPPRALLRMASSGTRQHRVLPKVEIATLAVPGRAQAPRCSSCRRPLRGPRLQEKRFPATDQALAIGGPFEIQPAPFPGFYSKSNISLHKQQY